MLGEQVGMYGCMYVYMVGWRGREGFVSFRFDWIGGWRIPDAFGPANLQQAEKSRNETSGDQKRRRRPKGAAYIPSSSHGIRVNPIPSRVPQESPPGHTRPLFLDRHVKCRCESNPAMHTLARNPLCQCRASRFGGRNSVENATMARWKACLYVVVDVPDVMTGHYSGRGGALLAQRAVVCSGVQ